VNEPVPVPEIPFVKVPEKMDIMDIGNGLGHGLVHEKAAGYL
jgi:hypothetical protein